MLKLRADVKDILSLSISCEFTLAPTHLKTTCLLYAELNTIEK